MTLISEATAGVPLETARRLIAEHLARTHYKDESPTIDSRLAREVRAILRGEALLRLKGI